MPEIRTLVSSEVPEPKHITNTTALDAGKVITPLAGGTSELRRLSLSDLTDGAGAAKTIDIINSDILNYQGWERVEDALITTPTITVTTTPVKLTIDDEGVTNSTNRNYVPLRIRGSSTLWDTVNSKITPIQTGDTYTIRINLSVTAKTGDPKAIVATLDIGGGSAPTTIVAQDTLTVIRSAPYEISFSVPVFTIDTFVANGGTIFLNTVDQDVTIGARSITIIRNGSGANV